MKKFLTTFWVLLLLSACFTCCINAITLDSVESAIEQKESSHEAVMLQQTEENYSYTTVFEHDFEDGSALGGFPARTKSSIKSNWGAYLGGFEPTLRGNMSGGGSKAAWDNSQVATFSVEPQSMYRLSFYFASIATTEANYYIDLFEGTTISGTKKTGITGKEPQLDWIPVEFTFETGEETSVTLRTRGDGGAPSYNLLLIDDIKLEKMTKISITIPIDDKIYDFEDGFALDDSDFSEKDLRDATWGTATSYPGVFNNINGKCLYKTFTQNTVYTLGSFPVSPNTTYTVSARIAAGFSTGSLYMYFYDGDKNSTTMFGSTRDIKFSKKDEWIDVKQEFTSGATTSMLTIKVKAPTGNVFFFDDIHIKAEKPELGMEKEVTSRIDIKNGVVSGGIRFKATISNEDRNKFADEYGFIVARKSHLESNNAELTHEFLDSTSGTPLFATGIAYNKVSGTDIFFEKNEDTGKITFTGVCVGIPTKKAATVKEELVARAYLRTTVGDNQVYVYGPVNSYSLGKAMLDVKTAGRADYVNNKEYVDTIVELYNS